MKKNLLYCKFRKKFLLTIIMEFLLWRNKVVQWFPINFIPINKNEN